MNILENGINLMLYGMGTVFVFLSILIITTILMSRLISRFFSLPEAPPPVALNQPLSPPTSDQIDPSLLTILQAAIDAHKK